MGLFSLLESSGHSKMLLSEPAPGFRAGLRGLQASCLSLSSSQHSLTGGDVNVWAPLIW